jgi:hypothetical protein
VQRLTPVSSSASRTTAALAIVGGSLALVGNLIAPRFNSDDVIVYRQVAASSRFSAAGVIVLGAVILVTAAFAALTRRFQATTMPELANLGRAAALVGGTIAVMQTGFELYAYKQQAAAFAGANSHNVVPAFWAANALDHTSSAMFATWTLVLLGITPILIGVTQVRDARRRALGVAALAGGAVCVVVGFGSLLRDDQSVYDVPFLIGSLIVTLWLIASGVALWRSAEVGAD